MVELKSNPVMTEIDPELLLHIRSALASAEKFLRTTLPESADQVDVDVVKTSAAGLVVKVMMAQVFDNTDNGAECVLNALGQGTGGFIGRHIKSERFTDAVYSVAHVAMHMAHIEGNMYNDAIMAANNEVTKN